MKILFIITQSEIGGAQRYLLELTKYLSSKGHEIKVAAGEGDRELFEKFSIFNFQFSNTFHNFYYISNLVRNLNPIKDMFALFSILKIINTERPDILFLQSTKAGFLGSLSAKIACYMLHATCPKIIYRIGGWSFRDPRSWWMNKILFYMEKIGAAWKDAIIVNSEFDRQLAIDKKIAPRNKIIKIYNGIDPNEMKFLDREEARKEFSIFNFQFSNNIKLIGTIANLYATKGLEYLAEAAHLINVSGFRFQVSFMIVGEGKERPKLESLIKKYNLENNFFLIGRIENAYKYLKAFDIFVLPSVKEGMPWAILEAMAAEVPIIATQVGAVPEIIQDGKEGLLVPPGNSSAIAEKIKMLIENPALREELSTSALNKLEEFSLKKMLEESEKILTL